MRTTFIAASILAALALPSTAFAADSDWLLFSAAPFDTQRDVSMQSLLTADATATGARLQIVQFNAPIRREWLDALAARGLRPVHYVAHNGYLVWLDAEAAQRVGRLPQSLPALQFSAPYHPMFKFDPSLRQRAQASAADDEIDIVVQLYRHAENQTSKQRLRDLARTPPSSLGPLGPGRSTLRWTSILDYENTSLRVRRADLDRIAELPDVVWLGLQIEMTQLDEKQNIILAGDPVPSLPSQRYLPFLRELGFGEDPSEYPVIDITDSPVHEGGSGVTAMHTVDATLRVGGDAGGDSRVLYFNNCSAKADANVGDISGHGTINASIVAGFDLRDGVPFQDADGHQLGLGVNPFARIGSTAIFTPENSLAGCGDAYPGLIASVSRHGAQIVNNSWGSTVPPTTYDFAAQAFDAGVRDADAELAQDQPLIQIFAAGNSGNGAATIGSPGTAKNVITVGASENLRPFWNDGCGTGPTGADDSGDVIGFSSRGPAPGGRAKPELIAPGTHVQGSASVFAGFDGSGVCDKFYPPEQTFFAASSGTSHAAPAVAGIASLAWWWIVRDGLGAIDRLGDSTPPDPSPSPALMKAWLMAHPTYLDGFDAHDTLPSNKQGYGMPNLSLMFDDVNKVLLDQSEIFTDSGDSWSANWTRADASKPVRIALAWTDAPGLLGTSPQVNDLDLIVTVNGTTYHGNRFDGAWSVAGGAADVLNNYEAVFLPADVVGALDIQVVARNVAGNAMPNAGTAPQQDFAVVCSNCARAPGFTLDTAREPVQVCAGDVAETPIRVGQISGFAAPITLAASGQPAGSTASFATNPVTAPAQTTLRLSHTGAAAPGIYTMDISGQSGALAEEAPLSLALYDDSPATPGLSTPAADATNVPRAPTLEWQAASQAHRYLVQIAADAAFSQIVLSRETGDTAWTVPSNAPLETNRRYWWRVIARNACGDSASLGGEPTAPQIFSDSFEDLAPAAKLLPIAESRMFITLPQPGDCPIDVAPSTLFSDTMEAGEGGWTHAASGVESSWRRDTGHAFGGDYAWRVDNAPGVGDQWLISPAITLPANLQTTSLKFMNRQSILAGSFGTCFDGALVEISTDDGITWQSIDSGQLTDPYDGPIATAWDNPLAGRHAWCGDPQAYIDSVIDLQPWSGHTVKLRFRLGNDRYTPSANPAWVIDDVRVTGCPG